MIMLSGFCRSTAVFVHSNIKTIIHMDVGDSSEVDRYSSKMIRLFIDRARTTTSSY